MPKRAVIVSEEHVLEKFHGVGLPSIYHFWSVEDDGILVKGENRPRRTKGEPVTATRIFTQFGSDILLVHVKYGIPKEIMVATIATESRGRLPADRYEANINDWSFGIMQTLTGTAKVLASGMPGVPEKSFKENPTAANKDAWKKFLDNPSVSIELGAKFLTGQNQRLNLNWDPILVYAAYNSGGVYESTKNPWGLVAYDRDGLGSEPGALDNFCAWHNDACFVLKQFGK